MGIIYRKATKLASLLLIIMILFLLSLQQWQVLQSSNKHITFFAENKESTISCEEAYLLQKENLANNLEGSRTFAFVAWNQKGIEQIHNDQLKSFIDCPIIAVCGRTDILFENEKNIDFDQENRCLIGYKTAFDLFGGVDVVGLKIKYQEAEYEIVDVIDDIKHAFVYQASSEEQISMNRISVKCNKNNSSNIRNIFSTKFSLRSYFDFELLSFIGQFLVLLVPAILFFYIAELLIKYSKHPLKSSNETLFWICVFIACLIITIAFLMFFIKIPIDYIPTKWSDFNFWAELKTSKQESILNLLSEEIGIPDFRYILSFIKLCFFTILSAGCCYEIKKSIILNKGNCNNDKVSFKKYM